MRLVPRRETSVGLSVLWTRFTQLCDQRFRRNLGRSASYQFSVSSDGASAIEATRSTPPLGGGAAAAVVQYLACAGAIVVS